MPLVAPGGVADNGLHSREMPREVEAVAHSPFDATDIGLQASVSPDPRSPQNMRFEIHIEAGDLLPRPTLDDDAKKVSVVFASYDENMNQPSPPRNRL
jgi:hypothetical protein